MNKITQMSESEMAIAVEMIVSLTKDGYRVIISTEADGIGLDNAFRATVKDREEIQMATSGGNARLSGALNDVYQAIFEMTPEKDDTCKHPGGIIRGMEG